jgi:uncharacterized protein
MKLCLEALADTRESFRHSVGAAWWRRHFGDPGAGEFSLLGEPRVEIQAWMVGEVLHLDGELHGEVGAECGRCLKRYRHALRDSFRLVLEPMGDRRPVDPESLEMLDRYGMCLGEEIEAGWYRGHEIELDGFMAEVISLVIPMQPICSEDCAGLCPVCGVDRSEESCDCEELKPDSPFAVLESLRGRGEGSS